MHFSEDCDRGFLVGSGQLSSFVERSSILFGDILNVKVLVVAFLDGLPNAVKKRGRGNGASGQLVLFQGGCRDGNLVMLVRHSGEGICLSVFFPLYKLDLEVKFYKLDGPAGLLWSIGVDSLEEFETSVIRSYCEDFQAHCDLSAVRTVIRKYYAQV